MNANEFGINYNLNVNFDVSGATSLSLAITRPDETVLVVVPSVGTTPLATPEGTFAANEWVTYKFVEGDINAAGHYSARLTYNNTVSAIRLFSDIDAFDINP